MEPNLPSSIDLTRLPPEAVKSLLSHYQALQEFYTRPQMTTEERLKKFDTWVKSHKALPHPVDDSRDSIYD